MTKKNNHDASEWTVLLLCREVLDQDGAARKAPLVARCRFHPIPDGPRFWQVQAGVGAVGRTVLRGAEVIPPFDWEAWFNTPDAERDPFKGEGPGTRVVYRITCTCGESVNIGEEKLFAALDQCRETRVEVLPLAALNR